MVDLYLQRLESRISGARYLLDGLAVFESLWEEGNIMLDARRGQMNADIATMIRTCQIVIAATIVISVCAYMWHQMLIGAILLLISDFVCMVTTVRAYQSTVRYKRLEAAIREIPIHLT